MSTEKNNQFATNALHAGHDPKLTGGTRAVPIYQSTAYVFDSAEHAAKRCSKISVVGLLILV